MKTEIRKGTAFDASFIFELEKQIFSDTWSFDSIRDILASDASLSYVMEFEGEVIAYILGSRILPEGEIYRVATKESMRGRGFAARLLNFLFEKEGSLGVTDLYLEVREGNVSARRLYTGCGFEEISLRKGYYKSPVENAVIMHRSIK